MHDSVHKIPRRALLGGAVAAGTWAAVRPALGQEGFVPLFNGENLDGWDGDTLLWLVEDGELVGRSPGIGYNDFLTTTKEYGDFHLKFQIKLKDNVGNSGVQFRSVRMRGSMEMIGYQADVGEQYWASLYDESRRRETLAGPEPEVVEKILKKGDWNDYEVVVEGPKIRLSLNGTTTVDYTEEDESIPKTGLIAVQVHSGPALEVRFREMMIREL